MSFHNRKFTHVQSIGALCLLLIAISCRAARTDAQDALPHMQPILGESFAATTSEPKLEFEATNQWWKRFQDPLVDELVEGVLQDNLDLQQAALRVIEADALTRSAQGSRGPAIDAGFSARRSEDNLAGIGRITSRFFTPSATISWQADLFGRLKATQRAQLAEQLALESDALALGHSLVSATLRRRVEISLLLRRLKLARGILATRTSTLEIVEGRYQRGVSSASAVDVHLARENQAAARASLPSLERELAQAHLALDELLGRKPQPSHLHADLFAALPPLDPPPTGLPAQLLDRRPDLIAAHQRLQAAAARVDVSIAARYPDLTLSATGGWSAMEFEDLFDADSFVSTLLGNLSAPLFASGRLKANQEASEARLEQLARAYAASALAALREVESALVGESGLRKELTERTNQRDEALQAEELARNRYSLGLENLLTVLDTERRRATAEEQVLLLQAAVWNARIDLHLALGGDWFAENTRDAQ